MVKVWTHVEIVEQTHYHMIYMLLDSGGWWYYASNSLNDISISPTSHSMAPTSASWLAKFSLMNEIKLQPITGHLPNKQLHRNVQIYFYLANLPSWLITGCLFPAAVLVVDEPFSPWLMLPINVFYLYQMKATEVNPHWFGEQQNKKNYCFVQWTEHGSIHWIGPFCWTAKM